jgi:hypothetical protein
VAASVVWLGGLVLLGRRLRLALPSPTAMLLAVFAICYLLLPLLHHLLFTPSAYRYITSSSNFFAFTFLTQLICWFVASALALTADRIGRLVIVEVHVTPTEENCGSDR